MKKIFLFLLILIIINYSFAILPSEVPPQPTPPGPTGPGPGTGTGTGHDQPGLGSSERISTSERGGIEGNALIRWTVGVNIYKDPIFSVGNTVLKNGDSVCQNDDVNVNLGISGEWFAKGGTSGSPPIQFYDLTLNQIAENLKLRTLSPAPSYYPVPVMVSLADQEPYFVSVNGNILCSKVCSNIPEIQTNQVGLVNFNANCNIECMFVTSHQGNRVIFTNNIQNIGFSAQFNVISSTETPQLSIESYSYNNGQLLATIKNNGYSGVGIESVQFDKAASEVLKPNKIDDGSKADFIYNINSDNVKMDIYFSADETGCLEETNFEASYDLNLAQAKTQPITQPSPTKPEPTDVPVKPKTEADPTKPIKYGAVCDDKTDVSNLKIDVGGFGVNQYNVDSLKKGESVTINDAKITSAVNNYLKYCSNDECIVPIRIKADNDFDLKINDIKVAYK